MLTCVKLYVATQQQMIEKVKEEEKEWLKQCEAMSELREFIQKTWQDCTYGNRYIEGCKEVLVN